MAITFRPYTIPASVATLGVVQLLGVAYVGIIGFSASPTVGVAWTAIFGVFATLAIIGRRFPDWVRGIAIGVSVYAGIQTGAYWLTTPTPPEGWQYLVGTLEGIALLIAAVVIKQWIDAGFRAAKLDAEALDGDATS